MKLGSAGEGFFVEKVENNEEKLEENQESSPIPSDAESEEEEVQNQEKPEIKKKVTLSDIDSAELDEPVDPGLLLDSPVDIQILQDSPKGIMRHL